jgi:hypothetical protein
LQLTRRSGRFLHGENEFGKVILREKLTQERLLPYLANQPASTVGCAARNPVAVLLLPSKLDHSEDYPAAVLFAPLVLLVSALHPKAEL